MNSPSEENMFQPFSWWVSRHNQKMDYWGGALPGSRKCECGILGTCTDPTKWCNCDGQGPINADIWLVDAGKSKVMIQWLLLLLFTKILNQLCLMIQTLGHCYFY